MKTLGGRPWVSVLLCCACLSSLGASGWAQHASRSEDGVVVYPERTTAVEVSNTDVNRIVCPVEPQEIVYSKEKGLMVTASGRNLFLKFVVSKRGEETLYTVTRNEIYLTVGEDVYSIILYPRQVPGQTIWLQQSKPGRWEEAAKSYGTLPLEAKLVRLMREAYRDTLPEGAPRRSVGRVVEGVVPGLAVVMDREVHLEGQGLRLKVYTIENLLDTPMQLSERMFLTVRISRRPVAVALEKVGLDPRERGRLFVVERVLDSGDS